ncbi:MAG: hypothetical protein A3H98_01720 [Bacteroidetes bacterium RIFCSPLOWO2_02_FULL_36_8]|nr:MAG: hypothetical protein A3H98_01720 [Bacteroidetes bacterium RIFCSPLOWO2_02_FULL_36_8]OFY69373.1 MAG: hypothetical protein A3G23_01055 [Bacteroidetes bacterium RIFCSPLOWO2_12_FULL_37_12]
MKFNPKPFLFLFFYFLAGQLALHAQPGSDHDDENCDYKFLHGKEKERTETLKAENTALKHLLKEKDNEFTEMPEFPQFKEEPIKKILELGARIYVLQTSINRSLNLIDSLKSENSNLRNYPIKDDNLISAKDSLIKNYESMISEQKIQVTLLEEQLNLANMLVQKLMGK